MAPNTRSTNKNTHPGQADVTKKRRSSAQVSADKKRAEAIEESIVQAQQQKEHDLAIFEKTQREAAELEKEVASDPSKLTASTGGVTRTVRSVKLLLSARRSVIAEGAGTNVNDKRSKNQAEYYTHKETKYCLVTEPCSQLPAPEPTAITSSPERANSVASGDSLRYEYYETQREPEERSQWYSGSNVDPDELGYSQLDMISDVMEVEVHRGDVQKPLVRNKLNHRFVS